LIFWKFGTGFAFKILLTLVLLKPNVMKKYITTAVLLAMFATCTTIMAGTHQEEYLGLPGDNLNLYATMKLFQESETLESFERNLNDENSRINNLDLNGDNLIDYIRVRDYVDGDVHNIVLQVAINKKETQDVAVFTVQRFRNGQVQIQLIGDEALYGKNYIIEPIYDDKLANQTPNPGYIGNSDGNITIIRTTYYEVADWPVIRFIYMPGYVEWHSSWYWGYYPTYWHPWRPYYWHFYYGYHYNWYNDYYSHYRHCDHYRYNHWNDFYYSNRRSCSPYVSHRIESGHYEATYSHPDQRRQGEALYTRTNNDQGNRRTDQYSGNSTARRSDYQADQNKLQKGNSFSKARRTNTNVTRSASELVRANNSGTERRSASTFGNRPATTNITAQNSASERRSPAPLSSRSATPPATSYNSFSERRPANVRVDKSAANPKQVQNFVNSRPNSKPAPSGESFSSRRSSGQNQSVKSTGSSEKKKSAEPAKNSRRR
jgi:hypothetical protein